MVEWKNIVRLSVDGKGKDVIEALLNLEIPSMKKSGAKKFFKRIADEISTKTTSSDEITGRCIEYYTKKNGDGDIDYFTDFSKKHPNVSFGINYAIYNKNKYGNILLKNGKEISNFYTSKLVDYSLLEGIVELEKESITNYLENEMISIFKEKTVEDAIELVLEEFHNVAYPSAKLIDIVKELWGIYCK